MAQIIEHCYLIVVDRGNEGSYGFERTPLFCVPDDYMADNICRAFQHILECACKHVSDYMQQDVHHKFKQAELNAQKAYVDMTDDASLRAMCDRVLEFFPCQTITCGVDYTFTHVRMKEILWL